jgi:hypothetical protein
VGYSAEAALEAKTVAVFCRQQAHLMEPAEVAAPQLQAIPLVRQGPVVVVIVTEYCTQ